MHALRPALLLALLLAPPMAGAADPQVTQQLTTLAQQVAALQQEVATLRSMLSRTAEGDVTQTANGDKLERIADNASTKIGRSSLEEVAGSRTTSVGRELVVNAGDQLTLRSGSSLIVLRKDGNVTISGVNVQVRGAADVSIKGSRVLTN